MHDYFDIVGVSPDARAPEIRRASRRVRATHPDIAEAPLAAGVETRPDTVADPAPSPIGDTAVDFIDMAPVIDRMRQAFFGGKR
jgi:hypothetical protein